MLKQSFNSFLLILMLVSSQVAFAQESRELKSRDVLIKESIANLDADDIHIASQAATELGMLRATESVPALLRVLQSSRLLSRSEHIMAKDKNRLSFWLLTDVKGTIINSLGQIGDQRAVPVLKKYLRKPPRYSAVPSGNVAHALYQITGKAFEYKDLDGELKLFVPSPIAEEEIRKRFRPDLKPTEGLTASLKIEGHDPDGKFWLGESPLIIDLAISNWSKKAIEIDPSTDNFQFSSVAGSGERTSTAASLLSSPQPRVETAIIYPGQTIRLRWIAERLSESPLSRGWAGYVNIKCIYSNPRRNKGGLRWRGEQLVSNSVERPYFPTGNARLR